MIYWFKRNQEKGKGQAFRQSLLQILQCALTTTFLSALQILLAEMLLLRAAEGILTTPAKLPSAGQRRPWGNNRRLEVSTLTFPLSFPHLLVLLSEICSLQSTTSQFCTTNHFLSPLQRPAKAARLYQQEGLGAAKVAVFKNIVS